MLLKKRETMKIVKGKKKNQMQMFDYDTLKIYRRAMVLFTVKTGLRHEQTTMEKGRSFFE